MLGFGERTGSSWEGEGIRGTGLDSWVHWRFLDIKTKANSLADFQSFSAATFPHLDRGVEEVGVFLAGVTV